MIRLLNVVPSWPTYSLGDLFEVVGGIAAPQDEAAFSDDGFPFMRMKDVGREHFTRALKNSDDLLSSEHMSLKKPRIIPAGSILMPRSGSVGLNHRAILARPAVIVSHLCALIPTSDQILSEYAYYLLCQMDMRKLTKKTTGLDSINFSDVKNIEIPLPPLDEQKRIAAILDQADSLRRLRQHSLDRLNTLSQAIFHEMFGDVRINSMDGRKMQFLAI